MNDTYGIFGRRFKAHLSPRIAISHPITDRDNLFFNYGHFTQIPNYLWVYSKLSSISSELFPLIGNPNLNSEISVQYEIGARHQFTEGVAANFTIFYKDIYDYPTSQTFEKVGVGQMFIYRNVDYARSRGIEIEVKKKLTRLWGATVVYTYSLATGKSFGPQYARADSRARRQRRHAREQPGRGVHVLEQAPQVQRQLPIQDAPG